MSPRTAEPPAGARPSTPAGLGIGGGTNNNTPSGQRSVSSSSSTSLKGVAPCFHTTRPQFISSHIDRCEACRLKYARKAEQTTIPYSPLAARRAPAAPQPRPQSRQSVGGSVTSSMRPSSRASVVSAASRLQDTGGAAPATHHRSASAGTPLADARANTKRAIARAAGGAVADDSPHPALPSPPARGDAPMAAAARDGMPASPTEAVASRSRSRRPRTAVKAAASSGSSAARGPRRNSAQLSPTTESPVSYARGGHQPATALPSFPGGLELDLVNGDYGLSSGLAVDLTPALLGTLIDNKRDQNKQLAEVKAENARLRTENGSLRQALAHNQSAAEPADAAAEPANIFDPNSASAKKLALERAGELDRTALDKFEEFRRAYEDCEPSLRSNRAQFAGERPLSPPPARRWGGSAAATPMHSVLDGSDHDGRLASLSAAEVRRAGEDLMSTPARRKLQRTMRATSTRRPTRSRMARPLFAGESELSDDLAADDSDLDDGDDGEHGTLRNCLMSASNFGTFLVQYVARQCLDYNTLCDENKTLLVRLDEIEKRTAQLDKANRRLEESRSEQAEQAYDMSAQTEALRDKVDAAERNARRLASENEKLKQDLAQSSERGQALDDSVAKLNASLDKTRQRGEQEVAVLRRNASTLQQEKAELAKKNDELRVELKGKLQRAGLKANVDEYLASRRSDAAVAGAAAGASDPANAGAEAAGVAADGEVKRLKEKVQFWQKKTDRIDRKLRTEKAANKEAHRMLRTQQEETYRYQQMFGPLPHDEALPEAMESLAGYELGMPAAARRSSVLTANTDDSAGDSDALSGSVSDGSVCSEDAAAQRLARTGSQSSLSSVEAKPAIVDDEADDMDIRRYEMRQKNRRAFMATPRGRRVAGQKSATTAGPRRTRDAALTIDVDAEEPQGESLVGSLGESLGAILGASGQWGDPLSARRRSSGGGSWASPTPAARHTGAAPSLATEFGALGDLPPSSPLQPRSLAASSPLKPRSRSIRGAPSPFGESTGVFGMGFDASVSLAEQLAAKRRSGSLDRPRTVDASTRTDPLPATAELEHLRSVGVEPLVSHTAFAEGASQTSLAVASEVATQGVAATACSATATDPRTGMADYAVGAAPAAASREIQAEPAVASIGITTSVCAASARHVGVDSAATVAESATQAVPAAADTSVATDSLVGAINAATSCVAGVRDAVCLAQAEQADRGTAADHLEGTAHRGMQAVPAVRSTGIRAGAGPLQDAETATIAAAQTERGADALRPPVAETGTAAHVVPTHDVLVSTDDSMLAAWLSPLVPEGIAMSLVLAALARRGRPIYEIHAEEAAEAARVAEAERERLAMLAADAANAVAVSNAKVFANHGTATHTATGEFGLQVEPKVAEKQHQAGLATTAEAGTDAIKAPVLAGVAVSTDRPVVDRWAAPLDPVARLDQAVATAVEVADQAIETAVVVADRAMFYSAATTSTAVGPAFEQRDATAVAAVATSEAAAATGGALRNVGVSAAVDTSERAVDAETLATAMAAACTAVAVADATAGPACLSATRGTDGAAASCERYVESDVPVSRTVSTSTVAATADVATEPLAAAGTAGIGLSTGPYSPPSVGVAVARLLSTGMQAVPVRADMHVATSPVGAEDDGGLFDEASDAASSFAPQRWVPRSRPPVPALPLGVARSIRTPSPTIPLPPLPHAADSWRAPVGDDSAVALDRSLDTGVAEREESDGEDYGYIMVSPRTQVQQVPMSGLSSSHLSVASNASGKGVSSARGMSGVAPYAASEGRRVASRSSRRLGCDSFGNEDSDGGDSDDEHVDAAPMPGRFSTVRGIAVGTEEPAGPRPSVSVGVEANTDALSTAPFERPPDPLIVQSIARTMVGASMWKYTTRFGNSTARERRHQRYFWVQPYAKLLNWSKQPPSSGMGMSRNSRENGGRSVYMREVRIVEEPRDAGSGSMGSEPLYVIIVRTDHREIKMKAMTQADHDQWYMALSYLQSRRIITSTTYPSATMGASTQHVAGYNSDDSLNSRDTSMGSIDASQRVVLRADRRTRRDMTERSRSRSKSRPRGPLNGLLERPPLPAAQPLGLPSSSVGSLETANNDYAMRGVLASGSSLVSRDSSMQDERGSISAPPLAHKASSPQRPHRSTLEVSMPQRLHSLQTTPRSQRTASMMPPRSAPRTSESSKRLSIGLFRKMGGSGTSLFRHGGPPGDGADMSHPASPVPQTGSEDSLPHAPSIAAMMGVPAIQNLQADSRGSVRKMFSGSFLRALRSRESVVEEHDAA